MVASMPESVTPNKAAVRECRRVEPQAISAVCTGSGTIRAFSTAGILLRASVYTVQGTNCNDVFAFQAPAFFLILLFFFGPCLADNASVASQQTLPDGRLCSDGSTDAVFQSESPVTGMNLNSVTVSSWIKADAAEERWSMLINQGLNYGLALNSFDRNGILFYYYNGTVWDYVSAENTAIRDGQWHHVAGSYNHETGAVGVYLDGQLLASRYRPKGIVHELGDDFSIGAMQDTHRFSGCVDEIRIHDRALTDTELTELSEQSLNEAPTLTVSVDRPELYTGESAMITATSDDDGLPEASELTVSINLLEGPASALITPFNDTFPGSADSSIIFNEAGQYLFRIEATDGDKKTSLDQSFNVTEALIIYGPTLQDVAAVWHLDEGEGAKAADLSGNRQNGLLQSLPEESWSEGIFNRSLCLSGSPGQQVAVRRISPELQSPSVTVAAWVKVNPRLVTWGWVASQANNYGLVVNRFNNDDLMFYIYNGLTWESAGINYVGLLDGEWHHIAGSYDADSKIIALYMDGSLIKRKKVNRSIAFGTGDNFSIGSMKGSRVFDGCIDEVQVYSRALESEEVQQLLE